jgi:hypothetical protein
MRSRKARRSPLRSSAPATTGLSLSYRTALDALVATKQWLSSPSRHARGQYALDVNRKYVPYYRLHDIRNSSGLIIGYRAVRWSITGAFLLKGGDPAYLPEGTELVNDLGYAHAISFLEELITKEAAVNSIR